MNRREAKREACWRAASVIESALAAGWPSEQYPDEEDLDAVCAGLNELIEELCRRGWKAAQGRSAAPARRRERNSPPL